MHDEALILPEPGRRVWLLAALSELLRGAPWQHFVAAPIVLPRPAYFPERWSPDVRGVRRLIRRLLRFADLGLTPHVELFEGRPPQVDSLGMRLGVSASSKGAPGVFFGTRGGVAHFGADAGMLGDPASVTATLAYEVARAFRDHHDLQDPDAGTEEQLAELTAVYLGFGVLTANAAANAATRPRTRDRPWTTLRPGGLTPQELCFLLAAQVHVRGPARADLRELAGHLAPEPSSRPFGPDLASRPFGPDPASRPFGPDLASRPFGPDLASRPFGPDPASRPFGPDLASRPFGPDSAAMFSAAARWLADQHPDLADELGLPAAATWPPPDSLAALGRSLVDDDDETTPAPPGDPSAADTAAHRRVFRVWRRPWSERLLFTVAVAAGAAAIAIVVAEDPLGLTLVAALAILAVVAAGHYRHPRCSEPACQSPLTRDADACPRCGGTIAGDLDFAAQRLAAEQLLADSPQGLQDPPG